ncbi:MAG: septum formation initiator family protein [Candidatus Methylomirabilales bacterium]
MAPRVRSASMQQELPFGVRVRRGKQKLARDLKPILFVGGILLGGLLLYVWQHVQVVRLSYQLEQLREARITLIQEGKALRVELGRLRSVRRVEKLARRKLGMVNPVPGQVILVEEPR